MTKERIQISHLLLLLQPGAENKLRDDAAQIRRDRRSHGIDQLLRLQSPTRDHRAQRTHLHLRQCLCDDRLLLLLLRWRGADADCAHVDEAGFLVQTFATNARFGFLLGTLKMEKDHHLHLLKYHSKR